MGDPSRPGRRARGRPTVRHRLRYRFDNLLARGTWALLLWLGGVTFLAVLVSSLLLRVFGVAFTGQGSTTLQEDFWQSLLRVLDPGTMAGDVGWGRRVLALLVTLFGLLVAGTLIGIIAAGVEDRIDELRRGRSPVIEEGHIVILGVSSRLPGVVAGLVKTGDSRVVVLGTSEPAHVREQVQAELDGKELGRLVFRYGHRSRPADLEIVRIADARAVVVLATDDGDPDAVRTVLAVGAVAGGFDRATVVVELSDPDVAARLQRSCGSGVHPIVPAQAVARIVSYGMRARGSADVVSALLSSRGAAIVLRRDVDVAGTTFGGAVHRYADARPIGILSSDRVVHLNPAPETEIQHGDRLILIGAAHAWPERSALPPGRASVRTRAHAVEPQSEDLEHLLIVGWNGLGPDLLSNWGSDRSARSTVHVMFDPALVPSGQAQLPQIPQRSTVTPTELDGGFTDLGDVSAVVMLAYSDALSSFEADNRTMLDLFLLRRSLASEDGRVVPIAVQLLDDDPHSFGAFQRGETVISERVASDFIAQLVDEPMRRDVLLAMYEMGRPSVQLFSAATLDLCGPHTAAEIFVRAYEAGVVAIGWRLADDALMILNPHEAQSVTLSDVDEIIAIG